MPAFPLDARIARDEVHVVTVRAGDAAMAAAPGAPPETPFPGARSNVLDAREHERAARFHFERDRRSFIAAHTALRIVLGRLAGCAPASLRFVESEHGKPMLSAPHSRLHFNLSHAGERVLLAAALEREVGVDIERERQVDVLGLAARFFSDAESRALARLPHDRQPAAFFRIWTRKEAFVKALGLGLTCPLGDFDVALDDGSDNVLTACRVAGMRSAWRIVPVATETGYFAAVAAAAGDWRVIHWDGVA